MSQASFNEVEAARIAQQMEDLGLAFYRKAANRAQSASAKKVFHQLAQQELQHLERFQELERILAEQAPAEADGPGDPALADYLRQLLKTHGFRNGNDVDRLAAGAANDCDALAVGMQAERDAILFYREVMGLVQSREARAAFSTILDEEREHLLLLGHTSEQCRPPKP